MFEGLIEKILQQKLGKYIDGIDKQNLSVGVITSLFFYNLDMERQRQIREPYA